MVVKFVKMVSEKNAKIFQIIKQKYFQKGIDIGSKKCYNEK